MEPKQARQLGKYLRAQREAKGLSSRELAKRIGVTDSTIVRIEQGQRAAPRADVLTDIARALGIKAGEIFARAGYTAPKDLPSLRPYLRVKYGELPADAAQQIEDYAARLAKRHGVDLSGPAPGEDESPEPRATKQRMRKGGTR